MHFISQSGIQSKEKDPLKNLNNPSHYYHIPIFLYFQIYHIVKIHEYCQLNEFRQRYLIYSHEEIILIYQLMISDDDYFLFRLL